jgi:hypothetical protein
MKQLTSKFAVRALLTLSISLLLVAGLLSSGWFKASGSARPQRNATVQAAGRGTRLLNVQDGQEVAAQYRGEPRLTASLQSGLARARALAAEDLDGDAAQDVVAGYSNNGSGIISVQHGNPNAYAPKDEAVIKRIQQGESPDSLTPVAELYEIPEAVDFLAAGDFNEDGQKDVLTAARGGGLYLLAGDGARGLRPAERVALDGRVTAMATGEFGRADGRTEVAVSTVGPNGPALFIYRGGEGRLSDLVARYALPAEVTAIGFSQLDEDPFMDVAVATGNSVEIIHGSGLRDMAGARSRIEQVNLPFTVQGLALGDFIWDRQYRTEIAVLAQDGTLHMLEQGRIDKRPLSEVEMAERVALRGKTEHKQSNQEIDSAPSWQRGDASPWQVSQDMGVTAMPSEQISSQGQLVRSHVSFDNTDELLALDGGGSKLHIVQENEAAKSGASVSATSVAGGGGEMSSVSLDVASAPVAAVTLPPKINGERTVVLLQSTGTQLSTLAITPTATVTVNSTPDVIHNPGCATTGTGTCSLRDAVIFSNANAGTTISINAGTYQLTLSAAGENGICQNPNGGDLDFSKTTTVTGAGSASTIIQQTLANDRVMCLDLSGTGNITYNISGVTITGGRERYGIGGGGIVGGAAGDSLTLTNAVISNNQADTTLCTPTPSSCTNSGGGGVNVFGGNVTLSGSTIGGANAPGASQTDTTLANSTTGSGGGLAYGPGSPFGNGATGTLTVNNNTSFAKNTAGSTAGGGGGAELTTINLGTGSFSIGPASFNNNSATAGNGGGIIIESLGLTLSTTSVNSNTAPNAGHTGGGIYLSGGSLTFSSSSSFATNTAANTAGNAIAVNSGGAGGGVTVNGTGNNINDNVDILGNGTWTNSTGSAVTFSTLTLEACPGCPTPLGIYTANNSTTTVNVDLNMVGGTFNGNTGTLNITRDLNLTGAGAIFNQSTGTTTITRNYTQSAGTFTGSSGTVNLAGNFAYSGGTFTANTSTFNFNGSGAQSIGSSAVTFNNLTVNKTGGSTLTLNSNVGVASNLNIQAGTFDLQGFTANRTASGGTLTVANGTTLKIGGTNSLPSNYATHSTGATSTIEYSGTNQSIAVLNTAQSYGNLVTSGSGTKTVAGAITVATSLIIGSGTVLAGGANTINIQGTWTNNAGTSGFTSSGAGTVNFNGSGAQALNGATNFNNLTINNAAGVTLGNNVTVNNTLTLTNSPLNIAANTLTLNNTVSFTGAGAINSAAGGTVNYNQGSNGQAVAPGTYANLTFSSFNKTLPNGGTINISETFTPGTATGHTITGNTINFNGAGTQTIPAFTYFNLTSSNTGFRTLDPSGVVKIAGVFTPGTNAYTITSSTVEYNGSGVAQALPAGFTTYNNLTLNNPAGTTGFSGLTVTGLIEVKSGTFTSSSTYNNVQIDTGATLAATAGSTITVSGSWTNNGGTFSPNNGTVIFNSAVAQTIGGTSASTFNNLTNSNTAGLTFAANETVSGILALSSSNINTGANILTMPASGSSTGTFDVVGNVKRTGFITGSGNTLTFGHPDNRITIDSGTVPTDITVNLALQVPTGTFGGSTMDFPNAVKRTYIITPTGGSAYSATLRLHYLDSELNGNTEAGLILRRFKTTPLPVGWSPQVPTAADTTNNWLEKSGVTTFSPWTFNSTFSPTASPGTISGRVTDANGSPLGGVVLQLNGSTNDRTITAADGSYAFENVDVNNFYTVTPQRANFSFNPVNRSFSLVAVKTDAVFTATPDTAQTTNPLEMDMFFVRQQYLDFLGREPDHQGLLYWTGELDKCGTDAACLNQRRIGIAAAFFVEQEYQQTGSFVYRLYKGALGRQLSFNEFNLDRPQVLSGDNLEGNKTAFADAFVQRAEFMQKYNGATSADSFVDALLNNIRQTSGADLGDQRATLLAKYNSGSDTNQSRALVLREAIDNASFKNAEYNPSFVLMEYFGYLKRDPEVDGYKFWLNVLNNKEPGNYRGMVCSFITSAEYQVRFSLVVPHSNQECR